MTAPATLSAFTPETLRAMLDEITQNPEQYCYVNCGLPSEQCACYLGTSARLDLADKAPALAQTLLDALAVIAERDKTIAELRAALNNIEAIDPESMIDGFSDHAIKGLVHCMGAIARASLARLDAKGGE